MSAASTNRRLVRFLSSGQAYCLEATDVLSVSPVDALHESVDTIEFDGQELPVHRLEQVLGLAFEQSDQEHLIVVRAEAGNFGLIVSHIDNVASLPFDRVVALPPITRNSNSHFVAVADFDRTPNQTPTVACHPMALVLSPDSLIHGKANDEVTYHDSVFDGREFSKPRKSQQLLVFNSGELELEGLKTGIGFSVTQVLEVTGSKQLLSIPGSPPNVLGLTKWRHWHVPVVDLHQILGLPKLSSVDTRLVIVRDTNNRLLGFESSPATKAIRDTSKAKAFGGGTPCPLSHQFVIDDCLVRVPRIDEIARQLA